MLSGNRRHFLRQSSLLGASTLLPSIFLHRSPALRPQINWGVSSGAIDHGSAVIWSKTDRPARMLVEYATTESFKDARHLRGPATLELSDFTAQAVLSGLPAGQRIFYRVQFQSLEDLKLISEPVTGQLVTPPMHRRNIRFQWSGDTAGQGYGINPDWGGMRIYSTMTEQEPDFFIHSGDTIYADNPIPAEVKLPDGSIWRNLTTEATSKVAETLDEFRGNYAYNLMDEHLRRFNAQTPIIYQWDDHEVLNNWYPSEVLDDKRYTEKSVALLSARAQRAFLEYNPIGRHPQDPERIYRHIPYGPLLDVFVIDMRSYRAANSANNQEMAGPDTEFLGLQQINWLKQKLLASKAVWKVIASDMPIGLIVPDQYKEPRTFENLANGDGPARGRELEMAGLLRFIRDNEIQHTVWLTADVHYTAAHHYDPSRAQFTEFAPFYEFVSGPLNAGTFGPGTLDNTFGPKVLFQQAPPQGQSNLPPSAGMQFFGQVDIDGDSGLMRVSLRNVAGEVLYAIDLEP